MIDLAYIKSFFPPAMASDNRFDRYMLKEYLQLMILDHIATTPYVTQLAFIGGTNLRLIQGIDRFSEDLYFDCKAMSKSDFMAMTDGIIRYLRLSNIDVEPRDTPNPKLTAFRRNLHFPQMLFDLELSGHLKVEAQDQGVEYLPEVVNVNKMGFFFNVQAPPMPVLCAMKLSALLTRHKGRDFYDSLFLLSKTQPDYGFLSAKNGIGNLDALKAAVLEMQQQVDMSQKKRDFQHLLFREENAERITQFYDYISKIQ
jgi:predicted nucleotidyltransferase component of viral defense system